MTRTATANGPATAPAKRGDPQHSVLERLIVNGDLEALTPDQRIEWYRVRCDAAGLDPRSQPFQYVVMKKGGLKLYATKAATDQLIANRKLTVEVLDRHYNAELFVYEVAARVKTPDGQTVDDVGVVSLDGLGGEDLCNAMMKCVTKAKRRTVLSACGLGMLDETEVETIADARVVRPAQSSLPSPRPLPTDAPANRVEPVAAAAEPAPVEPAPQAESSEAKRWIQERIDGANNEWAMTCGEAKKDYRPLCNLWQLLNALVTKYLEDGLITPDKVCNESGKRSNRKMGATIAAMWADDPGQTQDDVDMYLSLKQQEAAREAGINLDAEPVEVAPS